eukprot:1648433-Alexandrium_andersonii.AAC.1
MGLAATGELQPASLHSALAMHGGLLGAGADAERLGGPCPAHLRRAEAGHGHSHAGRAGPTSARRRRARQPTSLQGPQTLPQPVHAGPKGMGGCRGFGRRGQRRRAR